MQNVAKYVFAQRSIFFGEKQYKINLFCNYFYENHHKSHWIWYHLVEYLIPFNVIPPTLWQKVPFKHHLQNWSILVLHAGHLLNSNVLTLEHHNFFVKRTINLRFSHFINHTCRQFLGKFQFFNKNSLWNMENYVVTQNSDLRQKLKKIICFALNSHENHYQTH